MTKGIADAMRDLGSTVRDKWDEGDFDDIPVIEAAADVLRKVSDARTSVRDLARRAKDDYDGLDIWNLGDTLLIRLADFIDESVRIGSYHTLEAEVTEDELRVMSGFFRAYAAASSEYDAFWPVKSLSTGKGHELLDKAYDSIERRFMVEWAEFGNAFLIGGIRHVETRQVPNAVVRLWKRVGKRPDATNLEVARIAELRRIVAMLREYCEKNFGTPFDYAKKDSPYPHLVRYGKGWKKGPLPLDVKFWGNPDVTSGKKTVEEVGADYVLLIGDLVQAAEIIEAWSDWLDGRLRGFAAEDSVYPVLDMLRETGDGEVLDEIEDRLRKEFRKAWRWLGALVLAIWM